MSAHAIKAGPTVRQARAVLHSTAQTWRELKPSIPAALRRLPPIEKRAVQRQVQGFELRLQRYARTLAGLPGDAAVPRDARPLLFQFANAQTLDRHGKVVRFPTPDSATAVVIAAMLGLPPAGRQRVVAVGEETTPKPCGYRYRYLVQSSDGYGPDNPKGWKPYASGADVGNWLSTASHIFKLVRVFWNTLFTWEQKHDPSHTRSSAVRAFIEAYERDFAKLPTPKWYQGAGQDQALGTVIKNCQWGTCALDKLEEKIAGLPTGTPQDPKPEVPVPDAPPPPKKPTLEDVAKAGSNIGPWVGIGLGLGGFIMAGVTLSKIQGRR